MSSETCPHCHFGVTTLDERCPRCNRPLPARTQGASNAELLTGLSGQSATLAPRLTPPLALRINRLADQMQQVFVPLIVICGLTMVLVALFIGRPVPKTPPVPQNIASIVIPQQQSAPQPAQAPVQSASPAAVPPAQAAAPPLNDVQGYLTFLQNIEQQRSSLQTSFAQTIASQQPSAAASAMQSAQDIDRSYLAQKAPQDCIDLSNAYFRLLQDQMGMIARSGAALQSGNAIEAQTIEQSASSQIAADAQSADSALSVLCSAQHFIKPFSIAPPPTVNSSVTAPPVNTAPTTTAAPANQPATTNQAQ